MLIREGARPQAGAHARVRELATMTAAEPETGAVFGITPGKWLPSSIHCAAQERSPRLSRSPGRADLWADKLQAFSRLCRLTHIAIY